MADSASDNSGTFWTSIGTLYAFAGARGRRQIWILALLTALGAISEVVAIGSIVPFLALLVGTSATQPIPLVAKLFDLIGATTRHEQLVTASIFLCIAAVAAGLFRVILTRMTQEFAFLFGHRLAVEIQGRTLMQPYAWHALHNSSAQIATLEKVEIVTSAVVLPLVQAAAAVILILVVLSVLLQIAPLATFLAGSGIGIAYYGLALFGRRRLEANSQLLDDAFERRIRIIQEGLGGIRDVILDGSQAQVLEQFRLVDLNLAQARANTAFVTAVPRYLIEPAGIIIIAALTLYLSAQEGGLIAALPALGALALGAQRLLPLVQQIYNGWSNIAANKSVLDDLVRRLKMETPGAATRAESLPFASQIEFRDVGFAYAGTAVPAVKGLSFIVPHGTRIAFVGRTGSGKSTTADLLMGLLEPAEGQILVDGVTLEDKYRQSWRANIAHVPQVLFLADATIGQNIAMTTEPDMDRVRQATRLARLDGFVDGLPDGYDTRVGERGARMSGGQRQRLALARAIYKDTPILVLDEATSALDDETEIAVATALDELQKNGRTIIIIAHRSQLVAGCDSVIRLERGRVTEIADRCDKPARS